MLLSHPNISIHLILIAYLASSAYVFASHKGNETDRLALFHIKGMVTNDPFGILSTWNESVHFCNWYGVTCSTRKHPQRVIKLDLQSQKLEGSISPQVGNLSFLMILQLQNNSFTDEMPSELGYLRRLQILFLQNNLLGGQIPHNISACYALTHIRLGYNVLMGNIPVQLGSLSKLQLFSVHTNKLTGGIPTSFGNFSYLRVLSTFSNNISGRIPDALGGIIGLTKILLADNKLIGTLSRSIFNISSIEVLDMGFNQIQGSLPSNLGLTLPNLKFLSIASNRFTGPVPTSLANATNLEKNFLDVNNLTGKMPTLEKLQKIQNLGITVNNLGRGEDDDLSFLSSLINATNLLYFGADSNNFKGMLPKSIGNFSSRLTILGFAANQIYGRIPSGMANLISLEWINLWSNQLMGNIPTEIGKLRNLKILNVNENKLSGDLPSSLGNLSMLIELQVNTNNLEGDIPTSLERCQNMLAIDLSLNNLSSTISQQVMRISTFLSFNVSHNSLVGPIPTDIGELIHLETFDVSENNLSGEIPSTLGGCVGLIVLIMDGNFFHGTIPSSLSSLRSLELIDLSQNNFSGPIPKYLEGITTLEALNISYNDFEGVVPTKGVFRNATGITLLGNNKLCGGVLELHLPKCANSKTSKKGLGLAMKVIVVISTTLSALSLILCFVLCYWFKERRGVASPSILQKNSLVKVSYQSLLKATNGFSSTNLIGMGRFGHVYKGFLVELGGKVVAVKVFNLFRSGGSRSFIAECEALRNIRHRNLVKVLTSCSSVDHSGNEFKAIVYEFMDNGSLDKWLHPNIPTEEDLEVTHDEYSRKLTLGKRLNIAIDVACAVNYLHCDCEVQIIHCDLKPSNVLLDNEMIGHLGDLGLARLLPQQPESFPTNQTSSLGIRGTVGYAALEYGMGSEVSVYGDVYSFGILLLEMFTGKRPTDEIFKEGLNLHEFSKMALSKPLIETIDPILLQEEEAWEASTSNANTQNHSPIDKYVQECLFSILRIGIACSEESPRGRPEISDVLARLHIIRVTLLKARGM